MIKASAPSSLGGIEFDCTVSRTKNLEAEVPQYPVESGYDVSDGIFYSPVALEVVATISETPVTWKNKHFGQNRIKRVCEELEEMFFSRKLVTFVTPDKVYKNMAITALSIPREEYANSVDVTFSLLQVTVTSASTVKVSSGYDQSGDSNADAGTTETKNEESSAKSGSILSKLFGWLFGG